MRTYVMAIVVLASCWHDAPPPTRPIGNVQVAPTKRAEEGGYWCMIDDGGYNYARFPCAVRQIGRKLVLAKMGGSVRFRGVIRGDFVNGFRFSGQMFCPWGDCTQDLHGTFRPSVKRGELVGHFQESQMTVRIWRAEDSEFGGAEYGGDEYGGFGDPNNFGGLGYGGSVYGTP